jgi:transposase
MDDVGASGRGLPATCQSAPSDLRRTVSAILWRHENGVKWRALPAELGPWWMGSPDLHSLGSSGVSGSDC